jgi:hypothetical protein
MLCLLANDPLMNNGNDNAGFLPKTDRDWFERLDKRFLRLHSDGSVCNCGSFDIGKYRDEKRDPYAGINQLINKFQQYSMDLQCYGGVLKKIPEELGLFYQVKVNIDHVPLDDCFITQLHTQNRKRVEILIPLYLSYYLAIIDGDMKLVYHTCDNGTFVIEPKINLDSTNAEFLITNIQCNSDEMELSLFPCIDDNCEFIYMYRMFGGINSFKIRIVFGEVVFQII